MRILKNTIDTTNGYKYMLNKYSKSGNATYTTFSNSILYLIYRAIF